MDFSVSCLDLEILYKIFSVNTWWFYLCKMMLSMLLGMIIPRKPAVRPPKKKRMLTTISMQKIKRNSCWQQQLSTCELLNEIHILNFLFIRFLSSLNCKWTKVKDRCDDGYLSRYKESGEWAHSEPWRGEREREHFSSVIWSKNIG